MQTTLEGVWTRSKVLVKCFAIAVIVLLLLIPAHYVQNLVAEREARQHEAMVEVSSKWAGAQNISGPVLAIPYVKASTGTANKKTVSKHTAFFLPDELHINTTVTPQERSRGIYKVVLYTSGTTLSGSFNNIPIDRLKIPAENILWNEAYVKLAISDTKGLNDELKLMWNDTLLQLTPQAAPEGASAMAASVPLPPHGALKKLRFSATFELKGSGQLQFTPVGKTTTVALSAAWPHPSFTGSILPDAPVTSDSGFTARWKSLAHNRSFSQYGTDETLVEPQLAQASFGVDLFIPVNGYQKTMRSVKYAALCILLTFAAFFLIETAHKKSVHPVQYGLIGLALVLFYLLLLSISEYTGFNISYAVAAVATIALIGWFVKGVLQSGRLSMLLSALLLLVYLYVFTILQLQDFALLLGSIGLFASLAAIMHFTKKISW